MRVKKSATAEDLVAIVDALVKELHPGRTRNVDLDKDLDRDLGFDSLSRAELLLRIERSFGVGLPEELIGTADTPRDFLRALAAAQPMTARTAPIAQAREVVGQKGLMQMDHPSMGAEDFAYYLAEIPGCYVRFGARKNDATYVPLHSPSFDIDEGVLNVGAAFFAQVATEAATVPLIECGL